LRTFKKILLVQTGFLGDLVLSTPVISALRDTFPESSIDVLCTKQSAVFLKSHPLVSQVIEFDKRGRDSGLRGLLRMARDIKNRGYDAVFSLHKSYRTALLLFLSRIPARYGFKESSLSFLYTKTAPRKDLSHEALRNLAILRVLDISPESLSYPLLLACNPLDEKEAETLTAELNRPYVTIAPGSVWKTKRWTREGFSDLARKIIESGAGVVLLGGPDDAESGDFIEQSLSAEYTEGREYLNLVGKIPIMTSAALIKKSKCLISNDSAPLHISAAVGTPVVAVFCATVPEFGFTPWNVPHKIVEKKGLACRPCGSHGGHVCPLGTDACQKEITSEQVYAEFRALCNEQGGMELR
jgi:heptosyltransferase II